MNDTDQIMPERPFIVPLGDRAVVVRFSARMDDAANRAARDLVRALADDPVPGVVEVAPSLVSVLLRYDPLVTEPARLAGEIGLRLPRRGAGHSATHNIAVRFGGADGPDLDWVAEALGLDVPDFIARHCASPLRVLATGFAPGFVYCGFHPPDLTLPRRESVRALVPAGSVLFAAGQTAITASDVPTGWHVIGRTDFRNFDAGSMPPTHLAAGDDVIFEAMT